MTKPHPAMPADDENDTIRSLFDSGDALRQKLDQFPNSNTAEYQRTLSQALSKYLKCKNFINQASLFSLNESLDDVTSGDIRYMTVDFHLGELTVKASSADRKATLGRAQSFYRQFLTICDAYDLISAPEKAALEKAMDGSRSSLLPVDPAARRNAKIAQFKREKELRVRIEALSQSFSSENDSARALYTSVISLCIMQTVQALEAIGLEMDLLAKAPPPEEVPAQREEDARRRERKDDGYNDKLDDMSGSIKGGVLLSKEGKPLRPFVLLDKRQKLRNGVFRPSHNLPTMTIDEYLEEERARGGIIEDGGEKSGERPEPNEDDYEAADRETMKAREWDEFTEQNPKGSGNTLNRG